MPFIPNSSGLSTLRRIGLAVVVLLFSALGAQAQESGQPKLPAEPPVGPPAPGIIVIEGQITDQVGAGGSNVSVTLHRKNGDGTRGEALATAKTNEFGDFQLRLPERIAGDVLVMFTKSSYADISHELSLTTDGSPPFVAEELIGRLKIAGNVLDFMRASPIARAEVTLKAHYRDWSATSDEQGHFEIRGLSPGTGDLEIAAEGFGRELLEVHLDSDGSTLVRSKCGGISNGISESQFVGPPAPLPEDEGEAIKVFLKPERIVYLSLEDGEGKPIISANVETLAEPSKDFQNLVSDEQGKAVLRGIHFDTQIIQARVTHDEFVSSETFDRRIEMPSHKNELSHSLVMVRAGRIVGSVMDAQTREPLYGARVTTGNEPSDSTPRDWADTEGKFNIVGVPPGSTVVTVFQDGYAPELSVVEVRANEPAELRFQLKPAVALKGVVKSEAGDPVRGAYLEISQWRGHSALPLRAMSAGDGKFVLNNAPLDEFQITVMARGFGVTTQTIRADPSNAVEIKLSTRGVDDSPGVPILKIGDKAPELEMTSTEGGTVRIPNRDGKIVLVDFWATWCGPCVAEIANLLAIQEKFGARKDFLMIGVSLDSDEAALKDFVKRRKIGWAQVTGESARKAAERYGVNGIPAIFVISADGKILAVDLFGPQMIDRVGQILQDGTRKTESVPP